MRRNLRATPTFRLRAPLRSPTTLMAARPRRPLATGRPPGHPVNELCPLTTRAILMTPLSDRAPTTIRGSGFRVRAWVFECGFYKQEPYVRKSITWLETGKFRLRSGVRCLTPICGPISRRASRDCLRTGVSPAWSAALAPLHHGLQRSARSPSSCLRGGDRTRRPLAASHT
jgi:hypothetical protein